MKRKSLICFLIATLFLGIFSQPMNVQAAETKNLDVVLVLDKSGSMETNDPEGMMRDAANMFSAMMLSDKDRIGVIAFNRDREQVVPLSSMKNTSDMDTIQNKINSIEYKGGTDIGNAVADAVNMFDKDDGHEHAILVVSDGRDDFSEYEKNQETKSNERLNDALSIARNNKYKIYCLGFGDEMSNTEDVPYKKLVKIASKEENVSTKTNSEEIYDFFVKILSELKDSSMIPIVDEIVIEPNVKEANIYLNSKEDISNVNVLLTSPKGKSIPITNNDSMYVYKSKHSMMIKMINPEEGTYKIKLNKNGVNIDVKLTMGYVPSYDYVLSSKVLDKNNKPIKNVYSSGEFKIRTEIQQDNRVIKDESVLSKVDAKAYVTAKDTGKKDVISLNYNKDGYFEGNFKPNHKALYEIDIFVSSTSFNLEDHLEIKSNKRPIMIQGELPKVKINKTFKSSKDVLVENSTLSSVVKDPDKVGFEVVDVTSSDTDNVLVQIKKDGILLSGLDLGSSEVLVSFKDGLGCTRQTSFPVKVNDYVKMALYSLPLILIIAAIIIAILVFLKKNRMIKGKIEINRITIENLETKEMNSIEVTRQYDAKRFAGRKKTLGNGIMLYAQEMKRMNDSLQSSQLYDLFKDNSSEMKQNLDEVKILGTFLGKKGCVLKANKGCRVSFNSNKTYGMAIMDKWNINRNFKVYTKNAEGIEIGVSGKYIANRKISSSKSKGVNQTTVKKDTGGFDDDFFK